LIEIGQEWAQV